VSERSGGVDLTSSSNALLGIALKVGATFAFTLMAAIARHLGDTIPVGQMVFFRSAFAFVPIGVFMLFAGAGVRTLVTKNPLMHARRAFTGVFAMFTYFGALTYLPLADVTAISFASPHRCGAGGGLLGRSRPALPLERGGRGVRRGSDHGLAAFG
jgi:hypothetical protein